MYILIQLLHAHDERQAHAGALGIMLVLPHQIYFWTQYASMHSVHIHIR